MRTSWKSRRGSCALASGFGREANGPRSSRSSRSGYAALYELIAAHSRLGLNVVVDIGHHDSYTRPLRILPDCARRLAGLPVLFVGVRCSIEEVMRRRNAGQPGRETRYETGTPGEPVPATVLKFQEEVHKPGIYDFEVDTTSAHS